MSVQRHDCVVIHCDHPDCDRSGARVCPSGVTNAALATLRDTLAAEGWTAADTPDLRIDFCPDHSPTTPAARSAARRNLERDCED